VGKISPMPTPMPQGAVPQLFDAGAIITLLGEKEFAIFRLTTQVRALSARVAELEAEKAAEGDKA
jgi:hypothetical protein